MVILSPYFFRNLIRGLLRQIPILISGQSNIDRDSRGLMDRLVEVALRCPNTVIEIGGHTDTDGDEAANMRLSERRAEAVRDYMLRAGLSADRLVAVGYGATRPLASNDTAEGKAQNRRIEFVVRQQP